MECYQCIRIFSTIGEAFNSSVETGVLLERVAEAITEQLELKGCIFRLLTRDQKVLEDVASFGLSRAFLDKGPVDAERSVAEALDGKTVLVTDCASDPRVQYPDAHLAEGIVSSLTVPLETRGQVIGTMRLFAGEKREFLPVELQIVGIVASFATRAITHCMFHNILERVTDAVRGTLDQDEVLDTIVEVVPDQLRARGATVHLTERGRLVRRALSGVSERFAGAVSDPIVATLWPRLQSDCVQIYRPEEDPAVSDPAAVRREGVTSQLFVPLFVRDRTLGALGVYTHSPYRFSSDELYFMRTVGSQCALAIENARMYATLREQYQALANDFQAWFERPHPQIPT